MEALLLWGFSALRDQHGRKKVAHLALDRLAILGLGHPRRRRDGAGLSSQHGVARGAQMGAVVLHAIVLARESRGAAIVRALVVLLARVDSHVSGQVAGGGERPAAVAEVLLALLVVGIVQIDVDNGHRGLVERRRRGESHGMGRSMHMRL